MDREALMRPAVPAEPLVWPMAVLMDPTNSVSLSFYLIRKRKTICNGGSLLWIARLCSSSMSPEILGADPLRSLAGGQLWH
jgi:hypothetical protein